MGNSHLSFTTGTYWNNENCMGIPMKETFGNNNNNNNNNNMFNYGTVIIAPNVWPP